MRFEFQNKSYSLEDLGNDASKFSVREDLDDLAPVHSDSVIRRSGIDHGIFVQSI